MVRLVAILLWSSLAVAVGAGLLLLYQSAHERVGESVALQLRDWALQKNAAEGEYPREKLVRMPKVAAFLPGPAVTYQRDGDDCIVFYIRWPLGPKYGLECSSGAWSYLSS
jgi:hypothetical protein